MSEFPIDPETKQYVYINQLNVPRGGGGIDLGLRPGEVGQEGDGVTSPGRKERETMDNIQTSRGSAIIFQDGTTKEGRVKDAGEARVATEAVRVDGKIHISLPF